jgi:hypothetical protein
MPGHIQIKCGIPLHEWKGLLSLAVGCPKARQKQKQNKFKTDFFHGNGNIYERTRFTSSSVRRR